MSVTLSRRAIPFILFWTVAGATVRVLTRVVLLKWHWSVSWDVLDAAAQTVVLSAVVSWLWWWAPATMAGGAIREFAIAQLYQVQNAAWLFPAVGVVAALPQWLLLRKYGWRSLTWLVVPAVVFPITWTMYSAFAPAATSASAVEYLSLSQWTPLAALSGAVSGFIEAIALVWIIAPEFARTTSPVAPQAPVPRLVAAPPHLGVVRTCLGILIALAIPIFMPKLMVEMHALPDPRVLPLALAVIVPWAVALVLLGRPGLQHAGLALAATASIVMLVPMVPLMVLWTMFSGFMLENTDRWVSYGGALAATVVLFIVAVQAIRAARSMPDVARIDWAWPFALVGCVSYAMIVATNVR